MGEEEKLSSRQIWMQR